MYFNLGVSLFAGFVASGVTEHTYWTVRLLAS
jgi:hypothetical protein